MKRTIEKKIKHLSVLFVILALALAACSPAASAGLVAGRTRSGTPFARNPIPITATPLPATPTVTSSPTSIPSPTATATPLPTQPPVSSGPVVMPGSKSGLGSLLVDSRGMTLYIFKNDTVGVSNCGVDCASAWPPLTVKAGLTPAGAPGVTGRLAVFKRSDGSEQVTYNGWPLYYYAGDTNPGDANGQGIGGLWFVAPLTASQPAQPTLPPIYPTMIPSGGGGY